LESERRYQALVEAAPDPILIHAAGACVFANRQAATLLGASSPDALFGRPVLELIHPDDRPAALERIAQAYAGTQTPRRDFRYLRLDGTAVEVEVNGTRIEFFGQPAILIFIRDITERKRAEEALRASEERYRGIVETAEEGIAIHEPDGTIGYVNQRMAEMLGYLREEIIGRSSLDFVDEQDREAVIRARESLKEQGSFTSERRLRRKDGSILWTLTNVTPRRDGGGKFLGYLAMHTDVTERKAAEDALAASQHLLHSVLEQAAEGITVRDAQGRVMFVNAVARRRALRHPEGTSGRRRGPCEGRRSPGSSCGGLRPAPSSS
jgi:PAS domain S-box-containing protein